MGKRVLFVQGAAGGGRERGGAGSRAHHPTPQGWATVRVFTFFTDDIVFLALAAH